MNPVIAALLVSFGAVFLAEMGDKSQLLVMAFAARFPPLLVLIGITISTGIVMAVSVGIGALLGVAIPERAITAVAGVAFVVFAFWTWRGDSDEEEDDDERSIDEAKASGRSPIIAASLVFGLSELGDKTMLATIALAADRPPLAVWAGATLGMVAADALAVGVGSVLGAKLPAHVIRIAAGALFLVFGLALIVDAIVS